MTSCCRPTVGGCTDGWPRRSPSCQIGTGAEAAAHWSRRSRPTGLPRTRGVPAFEASVRAGAAAADTFAFAEARRQFERAIDGWDAVDDPATVAGHGTARRSSLGRPRPHG